MSSWKTALPLVLLLPLAVSCSGGPTAMSQSLAASAKNGLTEVTLGSCQSRSQDRSIKITGLERKDGSAFKLEAITVEAFDEKGIPVVNLPRSKEEFPLTSIVTTTIPKLRFGGLTRTISLISEGGVPYRRIDIEYLSNPRGNYSERSISLYADGEDSPVLTLKDIRAPKEEPLKDPETCELMSNFDRHFASQSANLPNVTEVLGFFSMKTTTTWRVDSQAPSTPKAAAAAGAKELPPAEPATEVGEKDASK